MLTRPGRGLGEEHAQNSPIPAFSRARLESRFTFPAIPQSLIVNLNKIANTTRFTGKLDRQKTLNHRDIGQ